MMHRLITIFIGVSLAMIPASIFAQVFSQNQLIVSPFGSNGWVVSTTTSNGAKLSASSTPYFLSYYATNGTVLNASTTRLNVGSDFLTDLTGSALHLSSAGVLNAAASGITPTITPQINSFMHEGLDSGWADFYGVGTVSHDSSVFVEGSASIKIVTAAGGANTGVSKNITDIDLSKGAFHFKVRADNWTNLATADVLISTSGVFDQFFRLNLKDFIVSPANDEWIDVVVTKSNWADSGSANWATANQMIFRATAGSGTPTIYFDDWNATKQAKRPVVSVVFDDGWDDTYTQGRLKLDQYGMAGTAYVIHDAVGTAGYMTQAQIDGLADAGWDISGHGSTNLTSLSATAAEADVRAMKAYLVSRGYRGSEHYAWPNGGITSSLIDMLSKYFTTARNITSLRQSQTYVSPYQINAVSPSQATSLATLTTAVDRAIANNDWLIVTFHLIVTTPSVDTEYSIANYGAFIDYLNASGIDVLPVSQVLEGDYRKDENVTFTNATTTNATTTSFAVSGGLTFSSLTGLLQGKGASAITAITDSSTVGQILRVTGAATYAWGALNLSDTDAITGDLPFANLAQVSANSVLANDTGSIADARSVATSTLFGANVTSGFVLTSNGTSWAPAAPSAGGGISDPFTHPAVGQSATTSLMLLNGAASSTLFSSNYARFGGTASTTIFSDGSLSIASSTPTANSLFTVGTSTWTGIHVNSNSGKIGIGCVNTSPALGIFACGTNTNVNPNIKFLVQDASDARMGVAAGDKGVFIKSTTGTAGGGLYAYDYAAGAARDLALNEFGESVMIGATNPLASEKLYILGADNGIAQAIRVNAASASVTAADTFIDFSSTDGSIGSIAGTAVSGTIIYNTFTGSHYTRIDGTNVATVDDANKKIDVIDTVDGQIRVGDLLVATGEVAELGNKQNHLSKSKLSCERASKAVYGVYGGRDTHGRDTVLSIGTGKMKVTNTGESLEVGDLLMSSDVCGHVEKQKRKLPWYLIPLAFKTEEDDGLISNITAGKLMENIEWRENETSREVNVVYLGG